MNVYFKTDKNKGSKELDLECNFKELIILVLVSIFLCVFIFLLFYFDFLDFNKILEVFF